MNLFREAMIDRSNYHSPEFVNDYSSLTQNHKTQSYNNRGSCLKMSNVEVESSSTPSTREFINPQQNIDTCFKRIVTQSPLEVMAQRFGHVIREFQFNSHPINNKPDKVKLSDHPFSLSSSYFMPKCTSDHSTITTHSHETQSTTLSTFKLPILLSKSSLDCFHSKCYETVVTCENSPGIPLSDSLNQKYILMENGISSGDSMLTNLNSPFLQSTPSSHTYYPNLLKYSSSPCQRQSSFHSSRTSVYELQELKNEATFCCRCLNLSTENNKVISQDESFSNFKNAYSTVQQNIHNSNNFSIYKNEHLELINNPTYQEVKCKYDSYTSSISNPSLQSCNNYINKSIDYDKISSEIYSNQSKSIYQSIGYDNPNITLNEIYAWIMTTFAYYRKNTRRWQNSIRHALSFNDCFIKVPRPTGEAGKGSYWTVHPQAVDMFDNGSSMRRNRKFIDENRYRGHQYQNPHHRHLHNNNNNSNSNNGDNITIIMQDKNQQKSRINFSPETDNQLMIGKIQRDFIPFCQKNYHDQDDGDGDACSLVMKQSSINNNNNNNSNNKPGHPKSAIIMNRMDPINCNISMSSPLSSSVSVSTSSTSPLLVYTSNPVHENQTNPISTYRHNHSNSQLDEDFAWMNNSYQKSLTSSEYCLVNLLNNNEINRDWHTITIDNNNNNNSVDCCTNRFVSSIEKIHTKLPINQVEHISLSRCATKRYADKTSLDQMFYEFNN
ncbi:unnamed protein product [Heterobilharzia americana]|nr:unnamed protein product [Heterobilharzia americana]